jgi:acetyltransferase-like isoleucine patch superfamily enzyme
MSGFQTIGESLVHELSNLVGDRIVIGRNCRIDPFVTITGNVRIGDNTHIGTGACIFGEGGVTIESGVSVSPGVKVYTRTDCNPQDDDGSEHIPVLLKEKSMIGTNSVVLPGTVVGARTVIGALSLAKGKLLDGWLYAGVPAKAIRNLEAVLA